VVDGKGVSQSFERSGVVPDAADALVQWAAIFAVPKVRQRNEGSWEYERDLNANGTCMKRERIGIPPEEYTRTQLPLA
jgi:hypothetical protein